MRSVGGIHRTRLAASNVHRLFVQEAKRTVQKLGWQVPQNDISPTLVGAIPLPFPVSHSFEAAFGYKGNLRFVQFGYTAGSRQFGYSDGGDDLPSDESLWSWFLHHPAVTSHLPETRYPTLHGRFPSEGEKPSLEKIMRSGATLPTCHCAAAIVAYREANSLDPVCGVTHVGNMKRETSTRFRRQSIDGIAYQVHTDLA